MPKIGTFETILGVAMIHHFLAILLLDDSFASTAHCVPRGPSLYINACSI